VAARRDRRHRLLRELQLALVEVAERHIDVILPGFTHLQVAQPVSSATTCWPMSRCSAATPSAGRRAQARQPLPLGAAALAGTTYPLDRERVARTLGMEACARTAWTR
jgi:argininosuccinate lyase